MIPWPHKIAHGYTEGEWKVVWYVEEREGMKVGSPLNACEVIHLPSGISSVTTGMIQHKLRTVAYEMVCYGLLSAGITHGDLF